MQSISKQEPIKEQVVEQTQTTITPATIEPKTQPAVKTTQPIQPTTTTQTPTRPTTTTQTQATQPVTTTPANTINPFDQQSELKQLN